MKDPPRHLLTGQPLKPRIQTGNIPVGLILSPLVAGIASNFLDIVAGCLGETNGRQALCVAVTLRRKAPLAAGKNLIESYGTKGVFIR